MSRIEKNEPKQATEFLEENLPFVDSKAFEAYAILDNDYPVKFCILKISIFLKKN